MRTVKQKTNKTSLILIIVLLAVILSCGLTGYYLLSSSRSDPSAAPKSNTSQTTPAPETPQKPEFLVASDETLGSGFAVDYPKTWTNAHTGATNPQSNAIQTDENVITSPSGHLQVVLRTQTNIQVGRACTSDFIKLKYLSTDTTPKFEDGRFAAYVVYFPTLNLYQYHVGLQADTDVIRSTTPNTDTACSFMFSEFIKRSSSLAGVPSTYTLLSIRLLDLQVGENLKRGVTETQIANSLTGAEYEQAKQIVQSVHTK